MIHFIPCYQKEIGAVTLEKQFRSNNIMDFNISFVTVPIDVLVHPVRVIPDNSEKGCHTFYVVLPKQIGTVTLEKQYRSINMVSKQFYFI